MKSFIKNSFSNKTITVEHPEGFVAQNGILEISQQREYPEVEGSVKKITMDGIQIAQRHMRVKNAFYVDIEHDFPFLKMQFELQGHSSYTSKIKDVPDVLITDGTHQLMFLPQVKGRLFYPTNRCTVEINLSLEFLRKLFNSDLQELHCFGKNILKGEPALLYGKSLPILPAMKTVISAITNCTFSGQLKKVYLEAKVTELLSLQIQQFHQQIPPQQLSLKKQDIEALHYVKHLIDENISQPYTILQLSQLAGINDFKLKKGFKQLFGNTLFGYLTDIRLETARCFILENQYSISEVSYLIGYKHPQHFSAAFKRKFGFSPGELTR